MRTSRYCDIIRQSIHLFYRYVGLTATNTSTWTLGDEPFPNRKAGTVPGYLRSRLALLRNHILYHPWSLWGTSFCSSPARCVSCVEDVTDIGQQGLYGAFVIKFNLQVAEFRRKHLAKHGIAEAVTLAVITAFIGYFNRFLRIDMTESMSILFRECESGGDHDGLCRSV